MSRLILMTGSLLVLATVAVPPASAWTQSQKPERSAHAQVGRRFAGIPATPPFFPSLPGSGHTQARTQSKPTVEESWQSLRLLRAGTRIHVVDVRLRSFWGTLLRVSDEEISLRVKKETVPLPRRNVRQVSVRRDSKVLPNAMTGAASCGVSGAELGAAAAAAGPTGAVVFGTLGAALCGVGGAGAGLPNYEEIYNITRPN